MKHFFSKLDFSIGISNSLTLLIKTMNQLDLIGKKICEMKWNFLQKFRIFSANHNVNWRCKSQESGLDWTPSSGKSVILISG